MSACLTLFLGDVEQEGSSIPYWNGLRCQVLAGERRIWSETLAGRKAAPRGVTKARRCGPKGTCCQPCGCERPSASKNGISRCLARPHCSDHVYHHGDFCHVLQRECREEESDLQRKLRQVAGLDAAGRHIPGPQCRAQNWNSHGAASKDRDNGRQEGRGWTCKIVKGS